MPASRKPAAIKRLTGNPGNRPIPVEPEPTKGAPKPPSDLSGEAFAEWCRIVPELDRIGLLAKVDRAYLVAYCESWATFNAAREALREHGPLTTGRNGEMVKNPSAQVMRDAMDMMLRYGGKFGLSPADRASLGRLPSQADDDSGHEAAVLSILS